MVRELLKKTLEVVFKNDDLVGSSDLGTRVVDLVAVLVLGGF